jgi:ABC-2 type transport system permease protein
MDKLFVVIKREFMERVRNKWFVIMTLLMPALMAAMILLPAWMALRSSGSDNLNRIILIDASGVGLGQSVLNTLRLDSAAARRADSLAPARPELRVVTPAELKAAEDSATAQVSRPRSYAGYLALTDSTLITGKAHYAGRNASSIADMERLESALRQSVMMVRLGREGVKDSVIKQISRIRVDIDAERISEGKGKSGSAAAAIGVGFFLAFMLYMSIMLHGQNVLRGVLEEKMTRVAEVVLASVKPDTLLAGKVLGVGAVGLAQQVAWFALSAAMIYFFLPFITHGMMSAARPVADTAAAVASTTGAAPAAQPASMAALGLFTLPLAITILAFFLTGFMFYASLFAAAGSMVNSEQEAQQAAMPVIMLLIVTIIFLNPIMMNSNGTLAVTLSWLPFSSPIVMPMRMAMGGVPMTSVIGAWIVSAVGCAAAIWLAARIYRVGMLMYGKKPSMGELVKWIRYAG